MRLIDELERFAQSHERDGETRTADVLRRAKAEIVWLKRVVSEQRLLEAVDEQIAAKEDR